MSHQLVTDNLKKQLKRLCESYTIDGVTFTVFPLWRCTATEHGGEDAGIRQVLARRQPLTAALREEINSLKIN